VEARGNTAEKGAGICHQTPPFPAKYRHQQRRAANHSVGLPRHYVYILATKYNRFSLFPTPALCISPPRAATAFHFSCGIRDEKTVRIRDEKMFGSGSGIKRTGSAILCGWVGLTRLNLPVCVGAGEQNFPTACRYQADAVRRISSCQ
jgi:hypothetical protein